MEWQFKWQKELEKGSNGELGIYYTQLLPRGFVKPEDQEPNVEGLAFYFDAFRELSTCRPGGMGLLPIPFTAIVEYSRIYEIEDEDFEDFAYVMRLMDDTFMSLYAAKQERERRGNSANNANKTNHNQR